MISVCCCCVRYKSRSLSFIDIIMSVQDQQQVHLQADDDEFVNVDENGDMEIDDGDDVAEEGRQVEEADITAEAEDIGSDSESDIGPSDAPRVVRNRDGRDVSASEARREMQMYQDRLLAEQLQAEADAETFGFTRDFFRPRQELPPARVERVAAETMERRGATVEGPPSSGIARRHSASHAEDSDRQHLRWTPEAPSDAAGHEMRTSLSAPADTVRTAAQLNPIDQNEALRCTGGHDLRRRRVDGSADNSGVSGDSDRESAVKPPNSPADADLERPVSTAQTGLAARRHAAMARNEGGDNSDSDEDGERDGTDGSDGGNNGNGGNGDDDDDDRDDGNAAADGEVADDPGVGAGGLAGGVGGNILDPEIEFQLDGRNILGFTGPLLNLVCNVAVALGLMATCLGVAVRMPISFSQFILSNVLWAVHSAIPSTVAFTDRDAENVFWRLHNNDTTVAVRPDDAAHLLFGWFLAVVVLVQTDAFLSTVQRLYGSDFWLYSIVHAGLDSVLSVFKLGTTLVLKMILFPLIFGWGLCLITEPMFTFSTEDMYAFFMETPLLFALLQWLFGVSYMLVVTFCLLELRFVLHPEVLANIIRLPDPEQQMLRNLLLESVPKIAQRMFISTLVYMIPLIFFLFVPIQATIWLKQTLSAQGVFEPVHLQFHYLWFGVQLPLEMAVIHMAFLHIIENAKGPIRELQRAWLVGVCRALSLERWLLPREAPGGSEQPTPSANKSSPTISEPIDRVATTDDDAAAPLEAASSSAEETTGGSAAETKLLPREAPRKCFVGRMAAFYFLAWISTLAVFIVLVWILFDLGRFIVHTTARIGPDGGHDVTSLLTGGVVAHCLLHGLAPACRQLRASWRRRLSNDGYGRERNEKTSALAIASCRAVSEYFAVSVLCPLLLGHIAGRLIFSGSDGSDTACKRNFFANLHPDIAAVFEGQGNWTGGDENFELLTHTVWCLFQDWMLGVVLTIGILVYEVIQPWLFPANHGANRAARDQRRGVGNGGRAGADGEERHDIGNANAEEDDGPNNIILRKISTKYLFSRYSPVFAWALEVAVVTGGITLLARLLEPWISPDVLSAEGCLSFWSGGIAVTVARIVSSQWSRITGVFSIVHQQLLEEKYRVGWQLHDRHPRAGIDAAAPQDTQQ